MKMFQPFSRLIVAARDIVRSLMYLKDAVLALAQVQREQGPASERLEALELSRHQWEATCEGLLLKAEGKLRAANNSEARERALRKSYEHLLDPLAEVGDPPQAPDGSTPIENDAAPGDPAGVQQVRVAVAPSDKTLRLRAKFGVTE